jgi:predicted N-acetyltransferase YhbS
LHGSGIGRALREHAEKFSKQQGCTEMTLTTGDFRTELLPYYSRAGYRVVATEPGPPDWSIRNPFHIVHMAKPLE